MARHEPPARRNDIISFDDFTPYEVSLSDAEWQTPHAEYGTSVKLVWRYGDGEHDTVWDFVSAFSAAGNVKLGQNSAGKVSKFRAVLNALAGRPEADEIAGFDDETWEVDYADGTVAKVMGARCLIVGETRPRADGAGSKFYIDKYRPLSANKPAASSAARRAAPAAAPVSPKAAARAAYAPQPGELPAKDDSVDLDDIPF